MQKESKYHTSSGYVSIPSHYFKLFNLNNAGIRHRKVHLFIKSVVVNSVYSPNF